MKALKISNPIKMLMVLLVVFAAGSIKSYAQRYTGTGTPSDTVTYVLYNNELSFDSKRNIVYEDKKSVDSLVDVLAYSKRNHYRVIYQKEGKQAKVVDRKFLATLDKTGIYRLTIAYNRPDVADDDKALFVIKSK